MLVNHPAIKCVHVREDISALGKRHNTLVVETDLKIPKQGHYGEASSEFERLIDYLAHLSESGFAGFDRVEIRPYHEEKVARSPNFLTRKATDNIAVPA
ncbi:MAG: hypothetical protein CMH30_01740 [Micavibrio sp.]|nr:hypothetical protein [Micavibrio sp.]|tara:strand:+ start:313 stop:609 length:297 start_codon:yes stop_codon:yes gene_type:complete